MDIPVMIFLALLAAGCFIAGAAILIKSEGRLRHVILASLLACCTGAISYGVYTQCPGVAVYAYCGGE